MPYNRFTYRTVIRGRRAAQVCRGGLSKEGEIKFSWLLGTISWKWRQLGSGTVLPGEVITAQTLDGRKPRFDKYSGKCSTRSLLMSPEGLALLAVLPAERSEETFSEKFSRQQGLCWGRDCRTGAHSLVGAGSNPSTPPAIKASKRSEAVVRKLK